MRNFLGLAFLTALASLIGCSGESTLVSCASNSQCPATQICLAGTCTPSQPELPQCQSDQDCALGEICDQQSGACISVPAPQNDAGAFTPDVLVVLDSSTATTVDAGTSTIPSPDAGQVTDAGIPIDMDAGERVDAEALDSGQSTSCVDDLGCAAPNTICESGQCVPGCGVPGGSMCGTDEVCDTTTGRCVVVAGPCVEDSECAPPMTVCESGQCVPGCSQLGGIQCGPGEVCETSTGRCIASGNLCLSDLDCNTPAEICDLLTGVCLAGCGTAGCTMPETCDTLTGHCINQSVQNCTADSYEPNNTSTTAAALLTSIAPGLRVCPADEDYYSFNLFVGDEFEVQADHVFGEGNIDLELIDPMGTVVLAATSTTDGEGLILPAASVDGDHLLRVYVAQDLGPNFGNNYSLTTRVTAASAGRIVCTGSTCQTIPSPLPHSTSFQTQWDPCPGQTFSWQAQGEFEPSWDRACVGGIASGGLSGTCSRGTELNGNGPWSGSNAVGPITLSFATDGSRSSVGITSLVATCGSSIPDAGPTLDSGSTSDAGSGGSSSTYIVCNGLVCYTMPSPLPNSVTDNVAWNPCSGRGFTWQANGQFERTYDRACVGGIATAGIIGLCLGGTELNGNGPWTGSETGPSIISIATDGSISSDGITSILAVCQ